MGGSKNFLARSARKIAPPPLSKPWRRPWKLLHWPLMGGVLHLVTARRGLGGATGAAERGLMCLLPFVYCVVFMLWVLVLWAPLFNLYNFYIRLVVLFALLTVLCFIRSILAKFTYLSVQILSRCWCIYHRQRQRTKHVRVPSSLWWSGTSTSPHQWIHAGSEHFTWSSSTQGLLS